ncbi:HAD-IIA family hydrolase [Bifidobacterium sp. H1HS10N]|uniref:HAD-IIA family hydrolase n=1 Tax=Bifidobacterium kimbladii TaxID=1293826 RepID=UPI0028BD953E|nr:HAD-IIA family hydrolase [Bifidobacterium sp. H1HS10N]MDT7512541.1 HAD-IIA family hydrolase [Bifidobacterium sp. H1HS10N]
MTVFLKGTDDAPAKTYRLALLDLDGVVYRGADPVEHAAEGIDRAQTLGMRMAYTTNNASRFPHVVADQLRGFGLTLDDGQVITSAVVAARMLRRHLQEGDRVLVIGSDHLRDQIRRNKMVPVGKAADKPEAVIQAWYPELSWQDLAQASFAIEGGARYFTTNKDQTLPREGGMAPGNGAMLQAVILATGKQPEDSAGKPESAMYDEARQLLAGDQKILDVDRCLPVGDRLDTDIEAANRGGYDSMLVLTGVARTPAILTAPAKWRPTYLAEDLRGLTAPQPQPSKEADQTWRCGGQTAKVDDDGHVTLCALEGGGDPLSDLNAVRACACALWEYQDRGGDMDALDLPAFVVGA